MTPKEKAKDLVNKFDIDLAPFSEYGYWDKNQAKQCALITVDEVLKQCYSALESYWDEIKQEIELL